MAAFDLLFKFACNVLMNDKTFRCNAAFTNVNHTPGHGPCDGKIQVRIIENNERVRTA